LSFDCIMCGLCNIRCPAEIPQFHVAMLARRLYGKYIQKKSDKLQKRLEEIKSGKYDEEIKRLMTMPKDELKKKYFLREIKLDTD